MSSPSKPTADPTWFPFAHGLLLACCVAEFSQAWLYPAFAYGELMEQDGSARLPFRLAVWMLVPVLTAVHFRRRGVNTVLSVLAPFLPLWCVGVVAASLGFNPVLSLKFLLNWAIMALAATVVGSELSGRSVLRILLWTMFTLMVGSIGVSLLLPELGTMVAGSAPVWRGLFVGKNWLGMIAALCFVTSVSLLWTEHRRLALVTAVTATICLFGSDSKGGMVGGLTAVVLASAIPLVGRRLAPSLAALTLTTGLALVALFGVLGLPLLLDALHRDPTLTGRTVIWSVYLDAMMRDPWLGLGPGAYSQPSPITLPLAQKLSQFGTIFTPHNAFLGVFGDTGILGLIAFTAAMLWTAFLSPVWHAQLASRLSSAVAIALIINGLVETGTVFGASAGFFLVFLFRAMAQTEGPDSRQSIPSAPSARSAATRAFPT